MMKTKAILAIFILGTLLICAFACGGGEEETPVASQSVALTSRDFTHAVNTLAAEPLSRDFDLSLFALRYDEDVNRYFANGYYTWHLSPLVHGVRQSGAESWVLSFSKAEGAERAFDILAEPSRSGATAEGGVPITSTGERELPWGKIGDESRVFDKEISEILSSTERYTTTWYRVVARKDRVVVMVKGHYPVDPTYFAGLAERMVNRIP